MTAVIIGVGNRMRRDDGAGLAVADRLRARLPEGARALALDHVPPDLYERWQAAERVVLVDAARSGAAPGSVRRFERLLDNDLAFHQIHFVIAARALGRLPASLVVFAIEGQDFGPGAGLTPAVESAVAEVVAAIASALAADR